jgi:hypothetical protein
MLTAEMVFNVLNVELDTMAVLHRSEVALTHMDEQAAEPVPFRYTVGDVFAAPNSVPSTVIVIPPLRAVLYTLTPVISAAALTWLDAKSCKATQRNSNLWVMLVSFCISLGIPLGVRVR